MAGHDIRRSSRKLALCGVMTALGAARITISSGAIGLTVAKSTMKEVTEITVEKIENSAFSVEIGRIRSARR